MRYKRPNKIGQSFTDASEDDPYSYFTHPHETDLLIVNSKGHYSH